MGAVGVSAGGTSAGGTSADGANAHEPTGALSRALLLHGCCLACSLNQLVFRWDHVYLVFVSLVHGKGASAQYNAILPVVVLLHTAYTAANLGFE